MNNAPSPLIALIALAAACNFIPSSVPVIGRRTELDRIAGEWSGTYETDDGSRTGSIFFRLTAARDSAYGDVLMVVHDRNEPPADLVNARDPWVAQLQQSRLLSISFVRSDGGSVSGLIESYSDPICGCTLSTSFVGNVHDDVIDGIFSTLHIQEGLVRTGKWKVARPGAGRDRSDASR